MSSVAIVQSNYIPWKGYFDLIRSVDKFILFDSVQYTKRDYRNRNVIKTSNGPQWLSIPVQVKGKYLQKVCETMVSEPAWSGDHQKAIRFAYAKSPYFEEVFGLLESTYRETENEPSLSKINFKFLKNILGYLGCETELLWSMDFADLPEDKNERLIKLIKDVGGKTYLSGPSAKDYMDLDLFKSHGVDVAFADYSDYPPYPQLHGDYFSNVSIIDLLFNQGKNSLQYMKRLL